MRLEWIAIETLAVIIENVAFVYFASSRFSAKSNTLKPQPMVWLLLVALGLCNVFTPMPGWIYDVAVPAVLLAYLCFFMNGGVWHKTVTVLTMTALIIGSSLLGLGIASILTNVDITHTLLYQDTSRLVAIILIKAIQVVVFFAFAKKFNYAYKLKKRSTVLFLSIIMIVFLSLSIIFTGIHDFDTSTNRALTWLASEFLLILIVILFLYEMFVREENSNISLSSKLQRLELESHFYKELDAIHAEIRTWQHEYKNNLIALRTLIESDDRSRTLAFLDAMHTKPDDGEITLHTGNLVLDAVVSSKLWFAHSRGIDVSIQAVYPVVHHIDDNDLCAIAGNLLDNAIEACLRMSSDNQNKFITFSLLVTGQNMTISICNSFEGAIKRQGNRYLTSKDIRVNGMGLQFVTDIVEKYQGYVLREHADGVFETHVMLPLIRARDEGK